MTCDSPFNSSSSPAEDQASGREVCYIQSSDLSSFRRLFPTIVLFGSEQLPKAGGIMEENTVLVAHDGRRFYAISYKGDLSTWRSKVHICCQTLGLLYGTLQRDCLVLNNGEKMELRGCTFASYSV